ncbi:hypothetical protein K1719_001950 [Acacia pycnantha]|nr:hypothetical protein K1719_001950 [Acacia pycnantha]
MDATIALTLIEAVLILLAIAISKAITLVSPLDSCKDAESIPTVSSPSNNIVAHHATKYDIFLNFRGEDTRDTFSSYLYEALCNANVHTFMDHKLHKGDNISPILLKTIEESEISLIIFSKDYASSTWCMDELVHIMKCKDQYGRTVIPIFYNHDQERVQEWKNALMRSTNISGWDSKNIRLEPQLIKMIVKDILGKLHNKSSFHLEGLVGIDFHIQKVEGLLSEARIVGIWGMGGIGKTTLAKAVFDRLTAQFESFYFAKDVRQQVERNGLDELQVKCLKELFKYEDMNTYNLGSTFVKKRLQRKKILLVLDDVDNAVTINDLINACGWFGEGSRIIITSRDEQVLKNTSAHITYHVPQLDRHQAFHLFSKVDNIEIIVLKERSLISVNKYGYIEMHALLKEMGLEILRQQLMSNLEKPIRLWRHQDIYHVFDNDKRIEAIRCMSLDASKIKKTTLRACDFRKMHDLVFLDVFKSDGEEPSKLNICEDLDYVSEELRFLRWEGYPLSYVPLHCCAENLTILEMCNSNIRQLWKGNQHFPNLEDIILLNSKHLSEVPDLSQVPKIKVGGIIKGRSSAFVIMCSYLDLRNLSFNKLTLKVFVCGNIICSVRFKHEVIPMEEIEELRMWTQSLVSLLPFVMKVKLFERSIEFGHDFNQHFDYCYKYDEDSVDEEDSVDDEEDSVNEKEESSVDEERGDRGEMMNGHQVVTMSLMEDEEEEDVLMEHCCSKNVTFTRVPNSITRWSLLKDLTLKSLLISNEYCKRIKPLLDVTLFFTPDIIPPSFSPYVHIVYGSHRESFGYSVLDGSSDDFLRVSFNPFFYDFGSCHYFDVRRKGRF